ncbi:MAG: ChbG/HpnK family deacetylase [Pleurocapsa sp. SU_196_0]|nr:ChbG/HpnK family deacetylase [Pleurocapsa sp. SU_196_0]
MNSTSLTLERLGFAPDDRVVILHADDIGMCHATIPAFEQLLEFGLVSSYAIMTPCPWASAALEMAREARADVGVHITLTSEWKHYRWSPLSTRDQQSGLLDSEGFFPRSTKEIQTRVVSTFALSEMRAQFQCFADHGVQPTHMDSHMLSAFDSSLLGEYVASALEHVTPALFLSSDNAGIWMSEATRAMTETLRKSLTARGFPLLDHAGGMPLSTDPNSRDDEFQVRLEIAKSRLGSSSWGDALRVSSERGHAELRAICPDWRARVGDELVFRSAELRDYLNGLGVHVIGYGALKALFAHS